IYESGAGRVRSTEADCTKPREGKRRLLRRSQLRVSRPEEAKPLKKRPCRGTEPTSDPPASTSTSSAVRVRKRRRSSSPRKGIGWPKVTSPPVALRRKPP